MTEACFPSCQSWHRLVSSGRKTGQILGPRRSNHLKARWVGTGLSKLSCINLKAFILMPYCMKQHRYRRMPLQFNSYQCGIKNASQHSHHGSSILLQNCVQCSAPSLSRILFGWLSTFCNGWWNMLLHTCSKGFLQCTSDFGGGREGKFCYKQ